MFAGYHADEEAGTNIPVTDADKIDQWVRRWSKVAGYNLEPLFGDFWQWELTDATRDEMSNRPPFFPDDLVSQKTYV